MGVMITVYLMVSAHVLQLMPNGFLQVLEGYVYNERVRLLPPQPQIDPVVIVDIDEQSLAELGRWPWSRIKLAALIDRLFEHYQIHTLGLDMVLVESESPAADAALIKAVEGRRVVVAYHFVSPGGAPHESPGLLPEPDLSLQSIANRYSFPIDGEGSPGVLAGLLSAAADAGHINPHLDHDGVTRRVPALIAWAEGLYTTLSVAVVRAAMGGAAMQADRINERLPGAAIEWLELLNLNQTLAIPVDRELMMQIPFRGAAARFSYVSARDVLSGQADPKLLGGKIVLLGTTAPGLFDLRNTPVSPAFPGVEVHANAVSAILNRQLLHQPAWIDAWQLIVLALVMLLALIVMGYATPMWAFLGMLLIVASLVGLNLYWWTSKFWVVPLAPTLFGIFAGVGAALLERWAGALRRSRRVETTFARYVPKEVARRLANDPDKDLMAAREHHVAIMFTDIAGFTTLARTLSPQQIAQLLREVLTALSAMIHQHEGTIDKYIGDAIMAFWGAPLQVRHPEQQALAAALAMVNRLADLQQDLSARHLPRIMIGIGIHSGMAYVGDMGSSFRSTYTAIGDNVNLAARVEGLTRVYGLSVLVTEKVKQSCEADFLFRFVDRVVVKGYDESIAIYEPLQACAAMSSAERDKHEVMIEQWDEAYRYYQQGDWDEARLAMLRLFAHPRLGTGARALLQRIETLEANPPPRGWNGVWTMDAK
ncbi:MAG: adenylate/guanylate cyclase domain-containing protein [Betaproteobacteria bacterium]|nr:adenylate/guanylate cyclase domain-containing protein [Betaproteobacteria bacterium]NCV55027.1 adenylate/guanylate cyclase domain-containing protein [Betaproteobacteria bacterium]NCZ73952.1 adenylate/guanylate cyclase domain-containing protein [Betaproteobacteria bacterium]NDC68426.1 adenylate/guanylate cyclase domain-containing protein [Betaproteobacteria bacterium]